VTTFLTSQETLSGWLLSLVFKENRQILAPALRPELKRVGRCSGATEAILANRTKVGAILAKPATR
jgi:hypothetical protein